MDDFNNNNGNDSGVNLFKGPEPNADEPQNNGVNLEKTPELNVEEPQNNGVNLEKTPEPSADEPQNNGADFEKAPESTVNERQGVSNAQQGMNFSGQQNFNGIPNQNQPIQPVQPQFNGQNMNNMNNMGGYNPNQNFNQTGGGQGLAIASLVLGILSILGACCCNIPATFLPLNLPLAVIGVILGVMANKKEKSGLATGGIVTSIIGAVFGLVCLIIWVLAIIGVMSTPEFLNELS